MHHLWIGIFAGRQQGRISNLLQREQFGTGVLADVIIVVPQFRDRRVHALGKCRRHAGCEVNATDIGSGNLQRAVIGL